MFTWLEQPDIDRLERAVQDDPSAREAQRRLADEVTRAVHGEAALTRVQSDAALRFGGEVTAETLQNVAPRRR